MSTLRDPEKIAVNCHFPYEVIAQLRTVIKGQMVPARPKMPKSKSVRPMGMSDYIINVVTESLRRVKPDKTEMAWCKEKIKAAVELYKENKIVASTPEDRYRNKLHQSFKYFRMQWSKYSNQLNELQKGPKPWQDDVKFKIGALKEKLAYLEGRIKAVNEARAKLKDNRLRHHPKDARGE